MRSNDGHGIKQSEQRTGRIRFFSATEVAMRFVSWRVIESCPPRREEEESFCVVCAKIVNVEIDFADSIKFNQ